MKTLFTNRTIQILALQATIAILIAVATVSTAHAAAYTIFGQDNVLNHTTLTNSNAARAQFLASVFDANTNTLDTYGTGGPNLLGTVDNRNVALTGNVDRQYGIGFTVGGNAIYGQTSHSTQGYLLGALSGGENFSTTSDDGIYTGANNPRSGFTATAISGSNLMGGSTTTALHFDFSTSTTTNTPATGVKAFGFYGIDAGDTATNVMTVAVTYIDDSTGTFTIKPGGFTNGQQNNNAFFFGLVTPDKAFKSVTINNPQAGTDAVGYDSFSIGSSVSAVVVPEASTLVGSSLGIMMTGLVLVRRRKKSA